MSETAKSPPKAARLFTAFLTARAVYGLAYLGAAAGRWPVYWYFPLERRFAFTAKPDGLAMGWFGTTALALVLAALSGALAWLASGRGPLARMLSRQSAVLALARAGALILLVDFAYFGWTLMHQTPTPLPLPPSSG